MPRRKKSGTISEEPIGQYRRGAYDDDDNETDDESDASSNVIPSRTEAVPTKMKKAKKRYTNNDGEEWKNSQQKKDIIAAFLEEGSGIHKLTNAQIYEKYASNVGWEKKNATDNIRRLKNQYLDKEGPFTEKELNQVEPFRTRKGIKSKAYSLLLKAHVHSDQSGINRMTVEQIHQSHKCFQQYPLKDFKKYNEDMTKLAMKRKEKYHLDKAVFDRHMKSNPRGRKTDRELPYWDTSDGFEMLKSYFDQIEKDGSTKLTPKQLHASRDVYGEFPFPVFKNHYNQERRKRKEGNFWRHKMKINAKKEHMQKVDEMYDNWLFDSIDGDALLKEFNSLHVNSKEENERANSAKINDAEFWKQK